MMGGAWAVRTAARRVPGRGTRAGRGADWLCQVCRSSGGAAVSGSHAHPPGLVPVLSRGKHRSPRMGACFMELASYLAGERWSDHPACTHPLLAAVARDVNDYTSDAGRARLAGLIPSVIGLTGLDGHPAGWLEEQSRQALAQAPHAAQWARSFTRDLPISPKAFRRDAAPATVHAAVQGIALACVPQPDAMLHALLIDAIDACARWACHDTRRDPPCGSAAWAAACALTGAVVH